MNMRLGFGLGLPQRGRGSSVPAYQQVLDLAQTDGWTVLYDPTNPDTRTLVDGKISQIEDALGNRGPLVQATASSQPAYVEGRFGAFDAGLYASSALATLEGSFGPEIPQPFMRIVIVERIAGNGWIWNGEDDANINVLQEVNSGFWQVRSAASNLTSAAAADAGKHVFSVIADGANSTARLDGAQFDAGDSGTRGHKANSMGSRHADLAGAFSGYIGLAMIFSGRNDAALGRMETLIQSLGTFAASVAPVLMWVGL